MATKIHLWKYPRLGIVPVQDTRILTYIYSSFDEFLKYEIKDEIPSIPNNIGINVLISWEWKPSIQKAREQNLKEIIDLIEKQEKRKSLTYSCLSDKGKKEKDEDEEIEKYAYEDDDCDVYYKDHDYLLIVMCEIFLCHCETNFKIIVTDQDEPKVIDFLNYMKRKACDQIYRV